MSCSPQNSSPTSPLSPSWPMFSAPSSPMPTSSTSSDSSPIRSVAEFALLFVAFAVLFLPYPVSPTWLSLPFASCSNSCTTAICTQQERSFQTPPAPGETLGVPIHPWRGERVLAGPTRSARRRWWLLWFCPSRLWQFASLLQQAGRALPSRCGGQNQPL